MTPAPRARKAKARTPVPTYPIRKSHRAVWTLARTPESRSLASVQSELQTDMSMADGIQPARASRNGNATAPPVTGQGERLPRSVLGAVTSAARSVERASNTRMTLTVRSSALNLPMASTAAHTATTTPPTSGSDQSRPSTERTRNAVSRTTAVCTITAVTRVMVRYSHRAHLPIRR